MTAKRAVSTMDAAKECGVHYTTIRRWILEGLLPAYETPGGHLRILRRDLALFLESRKLKGRRPSGGPVRVLIVDDDALFRQGAVEFLSRREGITVKDAGDGFTAGRMVSEFLPHVVVLDLLMPGVDGFEVCRSVKGSTRTRHIAILVLTGFPTDDNLKRARDCGADVCLAKPVELDDLHAEVLRLANVETKVAEPPAPYGGAPAPKPEGA
jgi:excisionase family DNA binding protein